MAVNFKHLLSKPAGEAKKPGAVPAGDYPGIIRSFEFGDQNKNKTPYVRFTLGLLDWPDTVDAEDRRDDNGPIDLAKRQMRKDFYLTDEALWRLDEFLASTGTAAAGRTYDEIIPGLVGTQVTVEVQQYINQTNNEIGNSAGKVVGTGG